MPSFGVLAETTVARTVVSPYLARTAPSAWRAILPVSRTSWRPPQSRATRWMSNIAIFFHGSRKAKAMSKMARGCPRAAPRDGRGEQHLAILPWPSNLPSVRPGQHRPGFCTAAIRLPASQMADSSPARNPRGILRATRSTTNTEALDQRLVTPFIGTLEIIEQLATLRYELQQPPSRMVVLHMGLEMLGQVGDPL